MPPIFQISASGNTKCAIKDSFCKFSVFISSCELEEMYVCINYVKFRIASEVGKDANM